MIFNELSLDRKIFTQRMINFIIKKNFSSLDYCMKLFCRCPDALTQFTDVLMTIVLLLMTIMSSVDYAIYVNCIEDLQRKLKTIILVLKIFLSLKHEVSHTPIISMISVIIEKILTLE